jgi:hypothetical protein
MVCHTKSRSPSKSIIARSGAPKQSATVQEGLDCFALFVMTEIGIGSYRREPVLRRALAEPCPPWDGMIPVSGVPIQPASCIFPVLNRKSTRIFASPSMLDRGDFSKNLWRSSALRVRSGRGSMRIEGRSRGRACVIPARRRTIGAASPFRRDPLAASRQRA